LALVVVVVVVAFAAPKKVFLPELGSKLLNENGFVDSPKADSVFGAKLLVSPLVPPAATGAPKRPPAGCLAGAPPIYSRCCCC
jgi:hypothetical protein